MPTVIETPDFDKIANAIAAHWADGATGELADEIAAALRQVWNARGAVDIDACSQDEADAGYDFPAVIKALDR